MQPSCESDPHSKRVLSASLSPPENRGVSSGPGRFGGRRCPASPSPGWNFLFVPVRGRERARIRLPAASRHSLRGVGRFSRPASRREREAGNAREYANVPMKIRKTAALEVRQWMRLWLDAGALALCRAPILIGRDPGLIGRDPGLIGRDPGLIGRNPGLIGRDPGRTQPRVADQDQSASNEVIDFESCGQWQYRGRKGREFASIDRSRQ